MNETFLSRTRRLLGEEAVGRLQRVNVIVFGVGGVGSWCAESLVRTGVRRMTIVDGDVVCESNINRQSMATAETVGQPKVEAMRARLLAINPEAEITALHRVYNEETADSFRLEEYDVIIDAIDSLADKARLIRHACAIGSAECGAQGVPLFFSSMGAARKVDPTRVAVAEFWKVKGCPLARALRGRLKKGRNLPQRKFLCVYSDEQPSEYNGLGSIAQVTAVFGFTLASLVVNGVVRADEAKTVPDSQGSAVLRA